MKNFSSFKLLRILANRTQLDTSAGTGINLAYVSLIERGLKIPTERELTALCQFYGTEPKALKEIERMFSA